MFPRLFKKKFLKFFLKNNFQNKEKKSNVMFKNIYLNI